MSPIARYIGELATQPRNTMQLARRLSEGIRSPDEQIQVAALLLRANLCENNGLVYRSIRDAEIAMQISGDQDPWGATMTRQHLGSMYGQTARYAEAVGYYRLAVEGLEELRAWDEAVEMRGMLATALVGTGAPAAAREALAPALGVVGDLPLDQPVVKPNHRVAAATAALAEIELAEGNIDTGLRRCRQVPPLMDWPNNVGMPGPATLIFVSGVIDAHVLHGHAGQVRRITAELTDNAVRLLGGQYWDLPQIGSVSCAIGTYLVATGQHVERGLELITLAPKVFGRQDYPSMQWQRHLDLHRPAVGDEAITAAMNSVAGLGRRAAAFRIMDHLEAVDGTL